MAQQPNRLGQGTRDLGNAAVKVGQAGLSIFTSAGQGTGRAASGIAGATGGVMSRVAGFATKYPKLTFITLLYAGLKTVQGAMNRRKEQKAQEAFEPQTGIPSAMATHPQEDMQQPSFGVKDPAAISAMRGMSGMGVSAAAPSQPEGMQQNWADRVRAEQAAGRGAPSMRQ
jgi:hypothetical protein